jgi:hypothetical protein
LVVQPDVDRLLALVCRELGAREAAVVDREATEPSDDARDIRCLLSAGKALVARFDSPPADRAAKQRRLEILASTFDAVAAEDDPARPRSRPPIARSLQEELRGLCARAAAVNALVVDANSPVVWGAAEPDGLGDEWPIATDLTDDDGAARPSAPPTDLASRAAIEAVRNLPSMAALRRGKHMRHVEHEGAGKFLAHSFAGIYCLVVVYPAGFDELRAERAVVDALGRIEQLVLALPPLDPTPQAGAGAIAVRRPRRR